MILINKNKNLPKVSRLVLVVLLFMGILGLVSVADTYLSWNYCYKLEGRSPYKSHVDCYVSPEVYYSEIPNERPPTVFGHMRFHLDSIWTAED